MVVVLFLFLFVCLFLFICLFLCFLFLFFFFFFFTKKKRKGGAPQWQNLNNHHSNQNVKQLYEVRIMIRFIFSSNKIRWRFQKDNNYYWRWKIATFAGVFKTFFLFFCILHKECADYKLILVKWHYWPSLKLFFTLQSFWIRDNDEGVNFTIV